MKKVIFLTSITLLFVLAGFVYFQFYFVFGSGVKTGVLNQIVYKGYIFKTHEGRLILSGVHSEGSGMLQSNTFDFSVVKKSTADKLMQNDEKTVRVHYNEYKHSLPWRGNNRYVVDSVEFLNVPQKNVNELFTDPI